MKRKKTLRPQLIILILGIALVLLFFFSFYIGRYDVKPLDIAKILISKILPIEKTWTNEMELAVINIRLPRILMAMIIGCALSAAGGAYQGVFSNPMASPDILGASSGAAFGAALAILMGFGSMGITLSAFLFSLLTVLLVLSVSAAARGDRLVNLILSGIMISSLFSAGTSYIKLVADPTNQLPQITYWLMGSLSGVKNSNVVFALLPITVGLLPLYFMRWQINLLSLGDEEARTLGVNTGAVRFVIIISATLITAASIASAGMIGWVGLVIPHLCRKLIGSDYRYLMPACFIAGAGFLLIVDNISRNLLSVEIPIGILTAFIGAPFFIYLIMRKEKTL